MTRNQDVLAKIRTFIAIDNAKRGPRVVPLDALMTAFEEAIADKRALIERLDSEGAKHGAKCRLAQDQLARWLAVRSLNR